MRKVGGCSTTKVVYEAEMHGLEAQAQSPVFGPGEVWRVFEGMNINWRGLESALVPRYQTKRKEKCPEQKTLSTPRLKHVPHWVTDDFL